jgi:hypothetical protein
VNFFWQIFHFPAAHIFNLKLLGATAGVNRCRRLAAAKANLPEGDFLI